MINLTLIEFEFVRQSATTIEAIKCEMPTSCVNYHENGDLDLFIEAQNRAMETSSAEIVRR